MISLKGILQLIREDTLRSRLCMTNFIGTFVKMYLFFQTNPLLKKKGIPECILFVTQRLTKYPLLVEPLIKTGVSQEEADNLKKALSLVKEILADVDTCVANKEREDRKLEIYNRYINVYIVLITICKCFYCSFKIK